MASLEADAFTSKEFVFLIGKEKTAFHTHASIIARQSKALNVLINGSMMEATSNIATFSDVSKETFGRFCQFAYTGNYATPKHTVVEVAEQDSSTIVAEKKKEKAVMVATKIETGSEEPQAEPNEEVAPVDEVAGGGAPSTKKPKKPKARTPQQKLRKQLETLLFEATSQWADDVCKVRENTSAVEDYTSVFLGHAELYVFAEKWGVLDLKMQTLTKLHSTLTSFTLFEARRRDVVELLRFVYDNENTRDQGDGEGTQDELRALVMLYTGCEFENLMKCSEFVEMLGEGGEFVQDLMKMLLRRLG